LTLFFGVASTSARVAATRARFAKVEQLAALLSRLEPSEIASTLGLRNIFVNVITMRSRLVKGSAQLRERRVNLSDSEIALPLRRLQLRTR